MNKCPFETIPIGTRINMKFNGRVSCLFCDHVLTGLETNGTYAGHRTIGGTYDYVVDCDLICPKCGRKKTDYYQICLNEGGSWIVEEVIEHEVRS